MPGSRAQPIGSTTSASKMLRFTSSRSFFSFRPSRARLMRVLRIVDDDADRFAQFGAELLAEILVAGDDGDRRGLDAGRLGRRDRAADDVRRVGHRFVDGDRQLVAGHDALGERRKLERRLEGRARRGRRIGDGNRTALAAPATPRRAPAARAPRAAARSATRSDPADGVS